MLRMPHKPWAAITPATSITRVKPARIWPRNFSFGKPFIFSIPLLGVDVTVSPDGDPWLGSLRYVARAVEPVTARL